MDSASDYHPISEILDSVVLADEIEDGEYISTTPPPAIELERQQTDCQADQIEICKLDVAAQGHKKYFVNLPVLGKEKAKQKLKALGNQKKIQMNTKAQITPKKLNNNPKKEKISPYEKAKRTINEIEQLKKHEDRGIPRIYYNNTMIHHIQPDNINLKSSTISDINTTASLEAIKCYIDDEHDDKFEMKNQQGGRNCATSQNLFETSDKQSRCASENNSDKGRSSGSTRYTDRSRIKKLDRKKRNSTDSRRGKTNKKRQYKLEEKQSKNFTPNYRTENNERECVSRCKDVLYTKTFPTIGYSFNSRIYSVIHRKLKGNKHESTGRLKNKRKKCYRKENSSLEVKSNKPESINNFKNKEIKRLKRSKSKKDKNNGSTHQPKSVSPIPSVDLKFEEDWDIEFPLSKDCANLDLVANKSPLLKHLENKVGENPKTPLPIPNATVNVAPDESPDTDEYMGNWEDEDSISGAVKDELQTLSDVTSPLNDLDDDVNNKTISDGQIVVTMEPEKDDSSSLKDGLGTPIFVNPSPPASVINALNENTEDHCIFQSPLDKQYEKSPTKELKKLSYPPSTIPFGMQSVYEEFLESVKEDTKNQQPLLEPIKSSEGRVLTDSGFCSSDLPLSLSTKINESSTSDSAESSSSSTSSTDQSSSVSSTSSDNLKYIPTTETQNPSTDNDNNYLSDSSLAGKLSAEDFKKLRALRKRRNMMKMLLQQNIGMDEEDKQCLLKLEKLIKAEEQLMMRNERFKKLGQKIISNLCYEGSSYDDKIRANKEILELKKDDANLDGIKRIEQIEKTVNIVAPTDSVTHIFDSNREIIKLKISQKKPRPSNTSVNIKSENDIEDQDFTDKFLKTEHCSDANSPKITALSSQIMIEKQVSLSINSNSSKNKKSNIKIHNLPSKHRDHDHNHARRKRSFSSRSESSTKKRRSNGGSSLTRRKSIRSSNKSSRISSRRSPEIRSPIRKSGSNSRSMSNERRRSLSPLYREDVITYFHNSNNYYLEQHDSLFQVDASSSDQIRDRHWDTQMYYTQESCNLLQSPNRIPLDERINLALNVNNTVEQQSINQAKSYLRPYNSYSEYMYTNEYMNTQFVSEFGYEHEYIDSEKLEQYSNIPIVNSANRYYYNDYNVSTLQSQAAKKIIHHDNKSGVSSTVAVLKGNVLEIVPASNTSKENVNIFTDIKSEPTEKTISDKVENISLADNNKKVEEKKRKRKSHTPSMTWRDEVAKRHIMSAVLRLNKEECGSPRGILVTKITPSIPKLDTKKVLFADGIAPGKGSVTSDEEEGVLNDSIHKQIKRKRHKGDNKENEYNLEDSDLLVLGKIDPELENAPPPSPPPGSPPLHLEQPVLVRPISPEEYLYFHFDAVVNSMYVSQLETPIPPRLLHPNVSTASTMKSPVFKSVGRETLDIQHCNGSSLNIIATHDIPLAEETPYDINKNPNNIVSPSEQKPISIDMENSSFFAAETDMSTGQCTPRSMQNSLPTIGTVAPILLSRLPKSCEIPISNNKIRSPLAMSTKESLVKLSAGQFAPILPTLSNVQRTFQPPQHVPVISQNIRTPPPNYSSSYQSTSNGIPYSAQIESATTAPHFVKFCPRTFNHNHNPPPVVNKTIGPSFTSIPPPSFGNIPRCRPFYRPLFGAPRPFAPSHLPGSRPFQHHYPRNQGAPPPHNYSRHVHSHLPISGLPNTVFRPHLRNDSMEHLDGSRIPVSNNTLTQYCAPGDFSQPPPATGDTF